MGGADIVDRVGIGWLGSVLNNWRDFLKYWLVVILLLHVYGNCAIVADGSIQFLDADPEAGDESSVQEI